MRDRSVLFVFRDGGPIAVAIPLPRGACGLCSDQMRLLVIEGQNLNDIAGFSVALQGMIDAPDSQ